MPLLLLRLLSTRPRRAKGRGTRKSVIAGIRGCRRLVMLFNNRRLPLCGTPRVGDLIRESTVTV